MIDLLEGGELYPPFDFCVNARASYDAIGASDACEPAGISFKLHFITVRDGMAHRLIRKPFWVDTRDVLADGLAKGGVHRLLLHSCSNGCRYASKHGFLVHSKVFGRSTTNSDSAKIEEEVL